MTPPPEKTTLLAKRLPRPLVRCVAAILLVLIASPAAFPVLANASPVVGAVGSQVSAASGAGPEDLGDEVNRLSLELDSTEKIIDMMLIPITVLVSILAAGGILGVVYSVRDQRRAGQLHELTVGGEVAAQRRSEQSYGSFFEQSQTTISLVNDTLQLAKEANDRAMKSMQSKAQARVDEIEERSQTLLIEVFGDEEFELIINDPRRRDELHDIAAELRSLEGYLSLQEIKLPQYTKFIKALDQFLLDDTEAAIDALRLAFQESAVGELRRFIEYWLGYMLTTTGNYEEAVSKFRDDEKDLDKGDSEYFQLDRIIAETEFFDIAKKNAEKEHSKDGEVTTPRERFELVAELLDELGAQAKKLEDSKSHRAKHHTRLEIARTRVDVYEWVAYDSSHLDDPLKPYAVRKLYEFLKRDPELLNAEEELRTLEAEAAPKEKKALKAEEVLKAEEALEPVKSAELIEPPEPKELQDPEVFRAWALKQAQAICEKVDDPNLDVKFARAECLFKLGHRKAADTAFEEAEQALHHEAEEFHEKRRSASLHQSVLICHARLLKLREADPGQKEEQGRRAREAFQKTIEDVKDMRQGGVTVFSQIQRRNVTQDEFRDEAWQVLKQTEGKGGEKDDAASD